ncbi:MAG: class E sortase [Solirubrobacteraceae bacterium]|nr:class E sortase [Patulibacter sp.]
MLRRFLRSLGTALLIAGVALVADAGLTVVWQEPISAVYAHFEQGSINKELRALDDAGPGAAEARALAILKDRDQKLAYLARSIRRRVGHDEPIAKITIPKLGLDKTVVNGTDTAGLRKGPGLIESTDLPGLGGTTAIAGHRTTYGAPFHSIDKLRHGDTIYVTTPYGRFDYHVDHTRIVKPTDVWVLQRVGREQLVMSACNPLYSASQRIIVFSELVGYTPPKTGPWAKLLASPGGLSATPKG